MIKMKHFAVSVFFLTSLFVGCIRINAQQAEYRKITSVQAHQMMSQENDFILLDVRTEEEFVEQRLDGAILIPDSQIRIRAERVMPDKDKLIFVYCRSGVRSAASARILVSLGYVNVYDFGGILDWPYGTVSGL